MVENAGPGSSELNQVTRDPIRVEEIVFPDNDLGKVTVWVGIPLLGMESPSRTRQWCHTLEVAAKVRSWLMRILVDLGLTGNYIDARECAVKKLQVENEEAVEELCLVNGSIVKTEGRV